MPPSCLWASPHASMKCFCTAARPFPHRLFTARGLEFHGTEGIPLPQSLTDHDLHAWGGGIWWCFSLELDGGFDSFIGVSAGVDSLGCASVTTCHAGRTYGAESNANEEKAMCHMTGRWVGELPAGCSSLLPPPSSLLPPPSSLLPPPSSLLPPPSSLLPACLLPPPSSLLPPPCLSSPLSIPPSLPPQAE